MKLEYIPVQKLPLLAWCAKLVKGSDSIAVYHGAGVETLPDFFCEGAWNGGFNSDEFLNATVLCGTGGKLHKNEISFVSGTDQLSPLFSTRKDNTFFISNSPVFVLAMADDEPDPMYPFYAYDFIAILRRGLECLNGQLRTASGRGLGVHLRSIVTLGNELDVKFQEHPLDEKPLDYAHYKRLLLEGVSRVLENARDPSRTHEYHPLALVSAGYDCNATASLAAAAGCEDAATLADSGKANPEEDSGAQIARIMGLNCIERDRWAFQEGGDVSEFSLFTLVPNPSMMAFEKELPGRILVTGNLGDSVWDKGMTGLDENLSRPSIRGLSGTSQIEYRLRIGYLLFAPGYIGARHARSINSITRSKEMQNWSVGGKYDRPIPRRIVEESGVPRQMFGLKAMGSSHVQIVRAENMPKQSLSSYEKFVSEKHSGVRRIKRFYWFLRSRVEFFSWWVFKKIGADKPIVRALQRLFPVVMSGRRLHVPWEFMFMFQWAFDSIKTRYKIPTEAAEHTFRQ